MSISVSRKQITLTLTSSVPDVFKEIAQNVGKYSVTCMIVSFTFATNNMEKLPILSEITAFPKTVAIIYGFIKDSVLKILKYIFTSQY